MCIKTHYVLNTYNYIDYIYHAVYYFCVFNIALLNSASTEYIYIRITQHNERWVKIRPHFNTLRMDSGCARTH